MNSHDSTERIILNTDMLVQNLLNKARGIRSKYTKDGHYNPRDTTRSERRFLKLCKRIGIAICDYYLDE